MGNLCLRPPAPRCHVNNDCDICCTYICCFPFLMCTSGGPEHCKKIGYCYYEKNDLVIKINLYKCTDCKTLILCIVVKHDNGKFKSIRKIDGKNIKEVKIYDQLYFSLGLNKIIDKTPEIEYKPPAYV